MADEPTPLPISYELSQILEQGELRVTKNFLNRNPELAPYFVESLPTYDYRVDYLSFTKSISEIVSRLNAFGENGWLLEDFLDTLDLKHTDKSTGGKIGCIFRRQRDVLYYPVYDYKIVVSDVFSADGLSAKLNTFGNQGYVLVSKVKVSQTTVAFIMSRVKGDKKTKLSERRPN